MSESDDIKVSPEEMSALMETIQETSQTRSRDLDADGNLRDVVRFDLIASRAVGSGQLPTLDLVNERLAGLMADALERLTSHGTSVNPLPVEVVKFVEFSGTLSNPTCVQLVELTGLRGTGMVVVDPNLLLHVIDLLLGGSPAKVADANEIVSRRGLTAVERRLFTHLTEVLSGTVTHAWDGLHELSLRPVRTETDAKHVAVFEPGEVVVDARFQVETAGCKGEIRFVLQQSSLRPLEKKLATGLLDSGSDEEADWVRPIMRLLRDVRVLSTAELGRTTIMLRELLGLKEGDVIRLDREPDNPITVFVEGTPKFLGLPTLQHGNLAVEVVSEISAKKPRSQQNTNGGQHE